jgi:hypothetical protein
MLQSHLHSLIAKAHRYQTEPDRFERTGQDPLQVKVHGANGDHQVVLNNGRLECDCDGFAHRGEGICAHVLGSNTTSRGSCRRTRSSGPSPHPQRSGPRSSADKPLLAACRGRPNFFDSLPGPQLAEDGAPDRVELWREVDRAIGVA